MTFKSKIMQSTLIVIFLLFGTSTIINHLIFLNEAKKNKRSEIKNLFIYYLSEINKITTTIKENSIAIGKIGEMLYELHSKESKYDLDSIMKYFIISKIKSIPFILGTGIWFEPYLFGSNKHFIGRYAYWKDNIIHYTLGYETEEYNYVTQPWYTSAIPIEWDRKKKRPEAFYITSPYLDMLEGKPFVFITHNYVMYNSNNEIIGVSITEMSLETIKKLLEKFDISKNSFTFFIDNNPLPKILDSDTFNNSILKKLKSEDEKNKMLNYYTFNQIDNTYTINFLISEEDKTYITNLLKSIGYNHILYHKDEKSLLKCSSDTEWGKSIIFKDSKENSIQEIEDIIINDEEYELIYSKTELGFILGFLISKDDMYSFISDLIIRDAIIAIIILLIIIISMKFVAEKLAEPISNLSNKALEYYETKNDNIEIRNFKQKNEINVITNSFNKITKELQKSQEDLANAIESFQILNDNSPEAIIIISKDELVFHMNKSAISMSGLNINDINSVRAIDLFEDGSQEQAIQKAIEKALNGEYSDLELIGKRRTGEIFYTFTRFRRIKLGEENFVMAIIIDITEQKEATEKIKRLNEELEQKVTERTQQLISANKELEAFSYSVSHDLQAPLRAILGFSSMLQKEYINEADPNSKTAHYINVIQKNTQQMKQLIHDLLNFSRLNKQPLKKTLVDPLPIINEVIDILKHDAVNRNIQISINELHSCMADPVLLKQVYANLLSNAFKYTNKCNIAIIEIGSFIKDDKSVYYVKDNGVGFDMQYAHKLYGVFQRLHRAEDYEGTGVGLATVQRIIFRHGGNIWAESQIDKGACFYFTL